MKTQEPGSLKVNLSMRMSFEELQQRLSKDQLQAFMQGMAEVVAVSRTSLKDKP